MGVNKLAGKVLINLLGHPKSVVCIINIIIDVPAVAYTMVSIVKGAVCRYCLFESSCLSSLCNQSKL